MTISHPLQFSHEDYRSSMTVADLDFIAGKFGALEHLDTIHEYRKLADPEWDDDSPQSPADAKTLVDFRERMTDEAVLVVDIVELIEHATARANAYRHYQEKQNLGYLALSGIEEQRYESMLGDPSEAAHFIGWFRSVSGYYFSRTHDENGKLKIGLDMGGNKQMGNWNLGRDTHALAKSLPEQVEELYGQNCSVDILDPTPKYRYEVSNFHLEPDFPRHPLTRGVATVHRRIPLANMHFAPGEVHLIDEFADEAGSMHADTKGVDIPLQTVRLYMPSQALVFPELVQDRRHREYLQKVRPMHHGATKEQHDPHAGEIAGHYFQDGVVRLRGQSNNVLPIDSRIITMAIRPNADIPV